ncbi:MAG TPA: tetratricopeptide repeat protein [Trebonia sp.]
MGTDRQGLELTGPGGAVAAYDRAVAHLVRFQPEVGPGADAAAAGGCLMGRVLGAYLSLLSTEAGTVAAAARALGPYATRTADESGLRPRERAHLAVARRWIAGDLAGAGALLSAVSVEFPHDLLALFTGHQIDFFRGDAVSLRDRIGRALGDWDPAAGDAGFLHGMYAFGLEECNQYGQAAQAGARAVDANPDDVWAIHAVVHTYEMQGQIPDGVRFMRSRRPAWAEGNFLNVHNAWHYALYLLQADDQPGALSVYDTFLHHPASEDAALELLDASALLWRLHLEGVPAGGRWQPLAEAWTRVLEPGYYPFNDMHAIMAYLGAGDAARARAVLTALERVARGGDRRTTGWEMTVTVGLPVCRSLVHFGAGQYPEVLDELLPIRTRVHEFGGSHAQRDAVERTLLEAAVRAGRHKLASALVSERLANRENSTYAWSKRALLLSRLGNAAGDPAAGPAAAGPAAAGSAAAGPAAAGSAAAEARRRELAAAIQIAVADPRP